ncbi:MAG: GTP pyrophosphokinase [Candidatus Dormibacteria bacterium]
MEMKEPLLERAIRIALAAHGGQTYPSPKPEPYILHPLRVMCSLDTEWEQIAAVLHDVVEDSAVTLLQLGREGFPLHLLGTLDCLTHRQGEAYSAYIERVATDVTAARVKIADLEDNLRNNRRLDRTPDVDARIERYERALARLKGNDPAH